MDGHALTNLNFEICWAENLDTSNTIEAQSSLKPLFSEKQPLTPNPGTPFIRVYPGTPQTPVHLETPKLMYTPRDTTTNLLMYRFLKKEIDFLSWLCMHAEIIEVYDPWARSDSFEFWNFIERVTDSLWFTNHR